MAAQYSTTLRNGRLASDEVILGTAPKLRLYSGSPPASCAAAATGTLLATLTCPSDWQAAPSSGAADLANGPWTGSATTGGTIGHFRVLDSTETTVHIQGTVGTSGADLILDSVTVAAAQGISISQFLRTTGNS
jgi:hypothetical protein